MADKKKKTGKKNLDSVSKEDSSTRRNFIKTIGKRTMITAGAYEIISLVPLLSRCGGKDKKKSSSGSGGCGACTYTCTTGCTYCTYCTSCMGLY